jgi:hypothetical protein
MALLRAPEPNDSKNQMAQHRSARPSNQMPPKYLKLVGSKKIHPTHVLPFLLCVSSPSSRTSVVPPNARLRLDSSAPMPAHAFVCVTSAATHASAQARARLHPASMASMSLLRPDPASTTMTSSTVSAYACADMSRAASAPLHLMSCYSSRRSDDQLAI